MPQEFQELLDRAPIFILAATRCFSLMSTLPFFSFRTIPLNAKLAFCGFLANLVLPHIDFSIYDFVVSESAISAEFLLLLLGEILLGMLTGFSVSIFFAAFSTAGQFFAFQMGFSASEVYDALSQVENPLMGQYLNLVAMLIFLQNGWAFRLFSDGILKSFNAVNAYSLVIGKEKIVAHFLSSLTNLFFSALIISLPLMGGLLLISISMGILGRAAPQMNLISDTFPVTLLFSFFLISLLLPVFCEFFEKSFARGFLTLESLWREISTAQKSFGK